MKELTRIITLEITEISLQDDSMSGVISKEEAAKGLCEALKNGIPVVGLDNVVVTNVQDFILDK